MHVTKLPGERVEWFRADRVGEFALLASKAARWTSDHRPLLSSAAPVMPEGLNDRAADNWRPLLAIADAAGGHWPEIARRIAIQLSGTDETDAEGTRAQLLADLREIFDETGAERLPSPEIIARLVARDDLPWAEAKNGEPITPPMLAKMLRQFHIRPKVYRSGAGTPRGYFRSDFEDAWQRYLAPETTKQPLKVKDLQNPGPATAGSAVAAGGTAKSLPHQECFGVSVSGHGGASRENDAAERAPDMEYDVFERANPRPETIKKDPLLDIPEHLRRPPSRANSRRSANQGEGRS